MPVGAFRAEELLPGAIDVCWQIDIEWDYRYTFISTVHMLPISLLFVTIWILANPLSVVTVWVVH